MQRITIRRILGEVSRGWEGTDQFDLQAQVSEIENVDELFPDDGEGRRVLDIGLERGFKSIALARSNYRVSGLDFSGARIASRQEWFYKPHGIEVVACDVTCEPVPHADDMFDYVMLNGVLEHWFCSPLHAFSEIYRVLKPGGCFVLETPNAANLRKRVWLALGRYPYVSLSAIHTATHPHAFHHREHTMSELVWLVTRSGFAVEQKLFRDGFHRSAPTWPKRLYWGITKTVPSFRDMLIVVARKLATAAGPGVTLGNPAEASTVSGRPAAVANSAKSCVSRLVLRP